MKILNFGSLNIDYVYNIAEFPRPGETINNLGFSVHSGGKGNNQSIALARAGQKLYHAGIIGNDGKFLKDMLIKEGADCSYIKTMEEKNGHAVILVNSNGQNSIIVHGGTNVSVDESFANEVLNGFGKGDLLLTQNEISCVPFIIKKAYEKGMRVVFNPSPATDAIRNYPLELVSIFILNETEGTVLTGKTEPEEILSEMTKLYPQSETLLTLGENGSLYSDGVKIHRQKAYKTPVTDTTAAGDTYTGYFIASIAKYNSISEAMKTASIAAAIAVSREGAADSIPFVNELNVFLTKAGEAQS